MTVADTSYQRSGRTKARKSQSRLIAAAGELFAEAGWHGSTIAKIADRSGVSRATMENHYTKGYVKQELIAEVYAPLVDSLREQTEADLAELEPLEATERLVDRLCVLTRSQANLTIALLTAVREETVTDDGSDESALLRRRLGLSETMAMCLRAGRERGQLPADFPVEDVASYHTNALLLRLFVDASEDATQMATIVLSQLRPVLEQSRARLSPP